MMENNELKHWLDVATSGLPPSVAALVCEELADHYECAVEDYVRHGESLNQAYQAALADLGDPRLTAQELRLTHMPRRRYYKAAATSMSPAIGLLALVTISTMYNNSPPVDETGALVVLLSFFLSGLLVVAATFYTQNTLKMLLGVGHNLTTPICMIQIGMTLSLIPMLLGFIMESPNGIGLMMIMGDPILYYEKLGPVNYEFPYLYELMVGLIIIVVAIGWVMIAVRTASLHNSQFYGLAPYLRGLMIFSGLLLFGSGLSVIVRNHVALITFSALVGITGPIKSGAFTLLFFRAAWRGEDPINPVAA